jgi:molecular chaperone GrpE
MASQRQPEQAARDASDPGSAPGRPDGSDPNSDVAETVDFTRGTSDLLALEQELAAERDRNLRLRAELENVRARSSREIAENLRYAALPLVRDLLPVVDNIDRALEAATKAGDSGPLVEGFRIVRQLLMSTLAQHNVREIPAQGELFDPQFHAAILQQPSAEVPAGHVVLVAQAGYQLHDRVIRPSQVIVSSGPGG